MKMVGVVVWLSLALMPTAYAQWEGRADIEAAERFLNSPEGRAAMREAERDLDAAAADADRQIRDRYGAGSPQQGAWKRGMCAKGYK